MNGSAEVVVDALFGGRLKLNQFRTGHRAGTDAVLLAAAAGVEPGDRFVDLGSGSGAVGLALALREAECRGILVDNDAAAAELAARNIDANGFGGRLSARHVDLFDDEACRESGLIGSASLVVTNPPFYEAGAVRVSPDPHKASAHVLSSGERAGHGAWLVRAIRLLGPRGRVVAIHRPDSLPDLLGAMGGRLGGVTLRAIHARADGPAIRILIGARAGSRAPLAILPALVLHGPDGGFTPEADALHAGQPMPFLQKKSRPRRAGLKA